MTAPNCDGPVCAAATCTRPPDPVLCRKHADELGQMLAAIGTEFDALDARPSMAAREPDTGGSGSLASQKAPARLDVLGLRDYRPDLPYDPETGAAHRGVLDVLIYWGTAVREQRGLYGIAPVNVADERAFLARQLPWILEQPAAIQFHDQIRRLWTRLRAANGHQAERPVLRCRRDTGHGECGGRVRLADGHASCGTCGHSVSGLALLRHGSAA